VVDVALEVVVAHPVVDVALEVVVAHPVVDVGDLEVVVVDVMVDVVEVVVDVMVDVDVVEVVVDVMVDVVEDVVECVGERRWWWSRTVTRGFSLREARKMRSSRKTWCLEIRCTEKSA